MGRKRLQDKRGHPDSLPWCRLSRRYGSCPSLWSGTQTIQWNLHSKELWCRCANAGLMLTSHHPAPRRDARHPNLGRPSAPRMRLVPRRTLLLQLLQNLDAQVHDANALPQVSASSARLVQIPQYPVPKARTQIRRKTTPNSARDCAASADACSACLGM